MAQKNPQNPTIKNLQENHDDHKDTQKLTLQFYGKKKNLQIRIFFPYIKLTSQSVLT